MEQYKELLQRILDEGTYKDDRTGVGTYSISGAELRFDLSKGFPLLTTKRVPFRLVLSELLWFIKGDTNLRFLLENNNHIWDEWPFKRWVESDEYKAEGKPDMTDFGLRADKDPEFDKIYQEIKNEFCERILKDDDFADKWGDCGRAYSAQWRNAYYVNHETLEVGTVDQLGEAIDMIKNDPSSRRIIVNSFTTDNRRDASLPACHHQFQFIVRDGKLDLIWDQRSVDTFLGLSFNISSYAALSHMVAQVTGLEVGMLIGHLKDVHIYSNHVDQVNEQLTREPKELPRLVLNKDITSIDDFTMEDVVLEGYDPHPAIKARVAV